MIKGIFLMEEPYMDEVSELEILSDLDFLYEESKPSNFNDGNYTMKKSSYKGENFITTIYETDYEPSMKAMFIAYDIIQKANPSFIKSFKYGKNKLIVSYPSYYEDGPDAVKIYSDMIDELLRVTVFLLRYNSPDEAVEQLREYIEMSVSYPSNRVSNL